MSPKKTRVLGTKRGLTPEIIAQLNAADESSVIDLDRGQVLVLSDGDASRRLLGNTRNTLLRSTEHGGRTFQTIQLPLPSGRL